jgi:hypothetical protein
MHIGLRRAADWVRFGAVFLLFAALGTAPASAQDGWRDLTFADDGFGIGAAVAPFREVRKVTTPAGPAEAHNYSFFPPPPGTVFMVTVTKMPAGDKRGDDDIVKDALKAKPVMPEPATLGGLAGLQVNYVQGEYDTFIVAVAKDRRLYQLAITRPSSTPVHPQTERWLESWRLLPPEGAQ